MANTSAVNWSDLNKFIIAWIVAPVLSGIVSVFVYFLLAESILFCPSSFKRGIFAIPYIYVLTICVNLVLIEYQVIKKTYGPDTVGLAAGVAAGVAVVACIVSFLFSKFVIVPYVKRKIYFQFSKTDNSGSLATDLAHQNDFLFSADEERTAQQTEQLFSFLQILSAVFTSFVHGSNDVSNTVGPLYGLYNAYMMSTSGQQITSSSPITYGLLAYGGLGMVLGLYVWGSRVIETIGENLTAISPSRGFAIEFGSALTVLIASMLRLSVSTTHCKVGSIVSVGIFSSWLLARHKPTMPLVEDGSNSDEAIVDPSSTKKSAQNSQVNIKLIVGIAASWVCTIPFAGLLSAGLYAALSATTLPHS